MLSFPNCKINLGLYITEKRSDGYHNLATIFYPLPFTDALEIIEADKFSFTQTGITVPGNSEDNLCVKAYHLLKKDFHQLANAAIQLHKVIPMGAGLGGGSADGAFTLKLLNEKFDLGLSTEQLIGYALKLGSDCPFFIINQPCYATGRGELLEPIQLDLSNYSFVLINPGIHVNTGWAFANLDLSNSNTQINGKEIIQLPVTEWKQQLKNDFEKPVFHHHPEIGKIKETLYEAGALYASMTGSGSTVYGIFKKKEIPVLKFPSSYWTRSI